MNGKTFTVNAVSNFAWYDTKGEALKKVNELQKQGITAYFGGKYARSKQKYHDLKIAAICHNQWDGSGLPWVVAW